MTDMMSKISAGLERAFANRGFAEPSVEDLRDAAGVSLRTLYKYTPSRAEMVLAALENRHQRYLARVFDDLPEAAEPRSQPLRALLERHKAEVAAKAAEATALKEADIALLLIIEGLTQAWPLHHEAALDAAKRLGLSLLPPDH